MSSIQTKKSAVFFFETKKNAATNEVKQAEKMRYQANHSSFQTSQG